MLLGGVLTDALDWHWIFLVNLPIGIAVFVALACGSCRAAGRRTRPAALDVAGAVTVTAALMLAVYAIVNGNEAGWTSAQTLGLLGALRRRSSRAFLVIESRVAAPLVPLALFRLRNVAHGERRRRPLGGRDVRVVLPLGALPAARARATARSRSASRSCRPT